MIRARIVSSLDEVGLDRAEWNAVAASSDTNSIFQTHEWTRSWLAAFGHTCQPVFVTVDGPPDCRGVAPFMIANNPTGERVLRFLGDGRSDYCDILTAGDKPQVLAAMLEAIWNWSGWDLIELNNIPSQSRTPALLRTLSAAAGFRSLVEDHFVCPTLIVRGREASVRDIFNKPSLRRRQNYFERTGELTFLDLTRASDIEPYLERFFDQHVARWKTETHSSLFQHDANRDFYRCLTRDLDGTDWLLFSVVAFNGHPVAFHYGFDYGGGLIWYKPSFDVAFEQQSPGLVMVRHLIGRALQHDRSELDFTIGDEPFKRRFTNCTRKTVRLRIYRDWKRYWLARSRRTLTCVLKTVTP